MSMADKMEELLMEDKKTEAVVGYDSIQLIEKKDAALTELLLSVTNTLKTAPDILQKIKTGSGERGTDMANLHSMIARQVRSIELRRADIPKLFEFNGIPRRSDRYVELLRSLEGKSPFSREETVRYLMSHAESSSELISENDAEAFGKIEPHILIDNLLELSEIYLVCAVVVLGCEIESIVCDAKEELRKMIEVLNL